MVALATSPFTAGCAVHARVDDGYYGDYHSRNDHEVVYYNRWEHDTHRDHLDFNKRKDADQKAYWRWRHTSAKLIAFCWGCGIPGASG